MRSGISSGGLPLWNAEDGVHLAWDAYRDLAGALAEMAECVEVEDDLSCSSGGSKRRQSESVVTLPDAPAPNEAAVA